MSTEGRELHARDSARQIFLMFCAICWIAWLALGGLTVGALYLLSKGYELGTRQEVLSVFWWTTYFCIGLPLAVRVFLWGVERYDHRRKE